MNTICTNKNVFGRLVLAVAVTMLLASCAQNKSTPDTSGITIKTTNIAAMGANQVIRNGKFSCAHGNKVELSADAKGVEHLIWKGRNYIVTPVVTTTGAVRFEHKESGLTWVQIPGKSMLLNTKQGQQLANDCTTP